MTIWGTGLVDQVLGHGGAVNLITAGEFPTGVQHQEGTLITAVDCQQDAGADTQDPHDAALSGLIQDAGSFTLLFHLNHSTGKRYDQGIAAAVIGETSHHAIGFASADGNVINLVHGTVQFKQLPAAGSGGCPKTVVLGVITNAVILPASGVSAQQGTARVQTKDFTAASHGTNVPAATKGNMVDQGVTTD